MIMCRQRANVLRDLRAPGKEGKRFLLSAHHFRLEDLKDGARTGAHKQRAKSKSWEDQNHLCGSGDGPRKRAKQLVAAAPPKRQEQVARAAARVQEHADAQVAAVAAAPTVEHQGQRVDANLILQQLLQVQEQNRLLQERTAYLEQMPAMSAERLAMDKRLQKGMRAQTGFGSYPTFLAFMDHFHVYYPKGVKVYRGLESVPKDKLEAAVAKNAKERGTAAPGAALPWWDGEEGEEGVASADGSSAAASGGEDAPRMGRVGSGICAGEEEGEEEGK